MSRRRAPGRATSQNDRSIAFVALVVKQSEGLAVRAFHPDGFRWFKMLDATTDEGAVRGTFAAWLATATEPEIERFVAAMAAYRHTLIDKCADAPPVLHVTEDAFHRSYWANAKELAGTAATVADAKARSAAGGRNGANKGRVQQGNRTKEEVKRREKEFLGKRQKLPSKSEIAAKIAADTTVDGRTITPDHVAKILRRLKKKG